MDAVRVVICGVDSFEIEGALQGGAIKQHPAWNRMYTFTCIAAMSVDKVDPRSLQSCHAVVLGGGARPAERVEHYCQRPTFALTDCPEASLTQVEGSPFFYGTCSVGELRDKLLATCLNPPHIIYSNHADDLSSLGECAYLRAFWIIDRKGEGVLDSSALAAWQQKVISPDATAAEQQEWLSKVVGTSPDGEGVRYRQFKQYHLQLLRDARYEDAWATLHVVDTKVTGLPYSLEDLQWLRSQQEYDAGEHAGGLSKVCAASNLYLSNTATLFFSNIFRLKRFDVKEDMWSFTPGCPWSGVDGLPTVHFTLDEFLGAWKHTALQNPEAVCKYARYWGFRGQTTSLFIRRNSRSAREAGEPLPNTLHVIVVGARKAGKRRLLEALTSANLTSSDQPAAPSAENGDATSQQPQPQPQPWQPQHPHSSTQRHTRDGADGVDALLEDASPRWFTRTTTITTDSTVMPNGGGGSGTITVVYTIPPLERVVDVLTDPSQNGCVDAVIMAHDPTNVTKSARYLIDLCSALEECRNSAPDTQYGLFARLPFLLVSTKADVQPRQSRAARHNTAVLANYCKERQLLWPPVPTSATQPQGFELKALTRFVCAAVTEPEIAIATPPLTAVRLLRRATFGAIVVLMAIQGIRLVTRT